MNIDDIIESAQLKGRVIALEAELESEKAAHKALRSLSFTTAVPSEDYEKLKAELAKSEEHNAALCERLQDLNSEVFTASCTNARLHSLFANSELENARLKAEVERLRNLGIKLDGYVDLVRHENERLRKAGDDLSASLTIHSNHPNCGARDEWLRAKKGLPSLAQQWEREKNNNDRAAKEGKPSV